MPGPGEYFVVPSVIVHGKDGVGRGGLLELDPLPRISVLDVPDLQSFDIEIPQELVDEVALANDR